MDATLDDLTHGLTQGHFTSAQLVRTYAARVAEVNHVFHAVIELNPDAEEIASRLDQERAGKGPRSPLHGVPFLLKDNIISLDRTEATCGSTVLLGTSPATEAAIVTILRKAGAVVLGRANLSEFAGFRHTNATTGWSPRGGQATGIFWPNMKASGSSTGSAISVGLGLTFASFGTETVSSLVSPSEKSCVVGLKPTSNLLPMDGVIPVSKRQDSMGYMARTVRDVAQILDTAIDFDSRPRPSHVPGSYANCCSTSDLRGVRVGVVKYSKQNLDKPKLEAFEETLGHLKRAGATIIDNISLAGMQEYEALPERMKAVVLETEFKTDMESYLSTLIENPRDIRTFEDLVNAVQLEPSEGYPDRNVDIMIRALHSSKNSTDYIEMIRKQEFYANLGGFEGSMDRHGCDVVLAPAGSLDLQAFSSIGGNPVMTVPMGFYPEGTKVERDEHRGGLVSVAPGIPFSLYLYGKRHGESQLLQVAYAFEQLSGARKRAKPYLLPKTDLKDIVFQGRWAWHL
ncbi:amidase signature domain-containing protein [Cercophora newfieldiana]|uniref:Amidase signature domain-containing protein n=1 Tax=Cercophora newfieldiana TaxID=92897 RepID=A0AA39YSM7_9PEZI|nr:amidase signature domain-containing protein [Cercophora newfieldiana]